MNAEFNCLDPPFDNKISLARLLHCPSDSCCPSANHALSPQRSGKTGYCHHPFIFTNLEYSPHTEICASIRRFIDTIRLPNNKSILRYLVLGAQFNSNIIGVIYIK